MTDTIAFMFRALPICISSNDSADFAPYWLCLEHMVNHFMLSYKSASGRYIEFEKGIINNDGLTRAIVHMREKVKKYDCEYIIKK